MLKERGLIHWLYITGMALLLLAIGLALWRWKQAAQRKDVVWERMQSSGVMRVGMDASFPPFEVVNEKGEFAGLDVDLAWELARRLGIANVAFVNVHFDGLYDALLEDKCDLVISALPYDGDLTQEVAYSPAYFNAGQRMVVRKEGNRVSKPGDLAVQLGRRPRIAVELGSEAHYAAQELGRRSAGLELLTPYTVDEALALLRAGKADAVVADAVTAYLYASQHDEVQLVEEPLTDEPYVIAMPLQSFRLIREVSQALAALAAEGRLERLCEHGCGAT